MLSVTVFNGIQNVSVDNNSIININISAEDYGASSDGINFDNNLYTISDFYITFQNLANTTLNFLVTNNYNSGNTIRTAYDNLPSLVDKSNGLVVQEANQFLYLCDNDAGVPLYTGSLLQTSSVDTLRTYIRSTTQIAGLSGSYINKGRAGNTANNAYSALGQVVAGVNDWEGDDPSNASFCTLICPKVNTIDDLIVYNGTFKTIQNNDTILLPINIYWKFKGTNETSVNINNLSYIQHNKSIRIRTNPQSLNTYFDFTIVFNISNKNS